MSDLLKKLLDGDRFSALSIMGLRGSMLAGKFLLALFIAHFMGFEALGVFGLIAGAAAVGQVVMRFGVFASLSRDAVSMPVAELTKNLRHYITGCLIAYAALLPIFLALGWYFANITLALLTFLVIIFEHSAYDIFSLTNNLQRPKLANVIYSLQSALWIYLFVALAFFIPALQTLEAILSFWIAGGVLASSITFYIVRHWPWKDSFSTPIERTWYRPYLSKSWRLYMSDLVNVGTSYLDRYLITYFLSLELVGVYVLFWQVSNAICNLVGAGVLQIFRPRLIVAYRENDSALFQMVYKTCALRCMTSTVLLGIIAGITVPFLIIYSDQTLAVDYLPLLWLMLVTLLLRIGLDVSRTALFAQSKDAATMYANILALVLSVIFGALFLHALGIYGVTMAIALTNLCALLYAEYLRRRIYP